MRQKKLITGLVVAGLAATVMTVVLVYWRSGSRRDKTLPLPPTLPNNIHQQSSGYSFTRSDEGHRIFAVHAARSVAFKESGKTVLEEVLVEFFSRTGARRGVLRTRQCEYNSESGELLSAGKVEMEFNGGTDTSSEKPDRGRQSIFLETSGVSFTHPGDLVVTEEPVRFRMESSSGSARGLTYAAKEGRLELRKDVAAELQIESRGKPQASVRLAAGRVVYDRQRGEITLWGPLEVTQGKRRIVAERGKVLLDERGRATRASLEGGVRGFDSSDAAPLEFNALQVEGSFDPASKHLRSLVAEGDVVGESRREGSIDRLAAQKVELAFEAGHARPDKATASGNSELTLEPAAPARQGGPAASKSSADKKVLTAAEMRFTFRPGGHSLQEIETVGEGKLEITPSDPKAGEQVMTAGRFLMAFDARSRLESLRALGRARVVIEPPRNAPPGSDRQETTSDRLVATFEPATGILRTVDQSGDIRLRKGDRQASSEEARYVDSTRALTLNGGAQVWDTNTRIRAEHILFDLRSDTAEGAGKVQGTHFEADGRSGPNRAGRGSAGADDPTNILADRMFAAHREQFVHYEGHVHAWRGQDLVESASLDVYRKDRRISSNSRVLTSHLQPLARQAAPIASASVAPQREARSVTIGADRLEFFDQGRRASYRGDVQLQIENTTLKADSLEVYFSQKGRTEASDVERAVADGQVAVTQPARRASGEHAEYLAVPGKIVLTGGPPKLYDAQKGFTTGQRLTFYIHDDTLLVDGGNKSPTLSKHRVAQ